MPRINYAKLYTLRKDGRYQAAYVDKDGKRKYVYDRDPKRLYEKLNDIAQPKAVTFADVAEDWADKHREEIGNKTWANYAPHYADIVGLHGKKPVENMTALDVINDLKRAQAQGSSATIISTRRSLYKMILDHALVLGHIQFNPAIGVKMPKGIKRNRREAPTENIAQKIMTQDAPFALFPRLLLCSGLRKAEALALTWGDITETHIIVNKALDYYIHAKPEVKAPKTEAGRRVVPIVAALRPFLVMPKGAKATDLVFPAPASNRGGKGGGYMTERQYEGAWKRYCTAMGFVDAAGKPTLTAHQLRHGTATFLFEAGVDMLTAQAILGHASPTTTREIYTHLSAKKQQSDIDKFNTLMSRMMSKSGESFEN